MLPANIPLYNSIRVAIINPIIGVMFGLALFFFVWGVVIFLRGSTNDKTVQKAKDMMWWGIVGLFIMASAAGIVNIICYTVTACK